jgi:HEAT repeat protein
VTGTARFIVASARRSDNPDHQAVLHRARYFRVVEALHTAVTSSSHTSLATRILGEVPILSDGSACFEAPADTPLFLEPVDAAGRRLEFDWQLPETSVPVGSKQNLLEMTYITARPGETKSCHGCHAPQSEAVSAASTVAALRHGPVSIERDLTDLLYRRNEPDEYRASLRIGETGTYRDWLSSPDADVRRRGCEALMAVEDGARQDAPAIAGLLRDPSAVVRRAAARALARLGSVACLPALLDALDDQDWQVRFNATAALEAVTACAAGAESEDSPGKSYRELLARLGGADGVRSAIGEGPGRLSGLTSGGAADLRLRWFEAAGRLGDEAPAAARQVVRKALRVPLPPPVQFEPWPGKRRPLEGAPPEMGALRAAGWMKDAPSVPHLIPWLARHEYPDHAAEAALALGRIGTPEAVGALWEALRRDVPGRQPYLNRYVQHGPRPEEYALLRGLLLAGAAPALDDVFLIVGLLPGTFLEKPRFEDRLRPESQRVLLGRLLLERARLRNPVVAILVDVLRRQPPAASDPLYGQVLRGINLERPYAEHQRPFPVVKQIEPEQALWLLGCLAVDRSEVPENLIVPYLTSENHRERIDAAVLLSRLGFGSQAAEVLAAEADKPYAFGEIMGIGKSHFDPNFRDKCYLVMALTHHADAGRLRTFADPQRRYRDVRYGLAVGLGQRGTADGVELLSEIATRDPISVVRRQARESLLAIQEMQRLAGRPVPEVRLPPPLPFEALYPPRGLTWPAPVQEPLPAAAPPPVASPEVLQQLIANGLAAENYRDLNNANNQAPGADRMMIRGMHPFSAAVAGLAQLDPQTAGPSLRQLLASPYPFAHYLVLRESGRGRFPELDGAVVGLLEQSVRSSDTVRFYWTCEALAQRRVQAAVPVLARLAHAESPPHLHGPAGMGHGYPAARALARLLGDLDHAEVQRLLQSENLWVRAGALAGLAEARAPGLQPLLERLLAGREPGMIRDHARAGLRGLKAGDREPRNSTDPGAG